MTTWIPYSAGDHKVNLSIDPFIEPYEVDYANNGRSTAIKVR